MNMAKKAKSSTPTPKWPKFSTRRECERYLSKMDFTKKEDYIAYVMDELAEYAANENTTSLTKFIRRMKLPRRSFYNMLEASAEMKEQWNEAKLDIAENRRELALWKKLNENLALRWLHQLDPEEKDVDKYWSDLKNQEAQKSGTVYIEIPKTREIADERQGDGDRRDICEEKSTGNTGDL